MARKPKQVIPVAPDMPPPTEAELQAMRVLRDQMASFGDRLRQRNLDNAVILAQQAARGQGPLVDHFAELGRRFHDVLNKPQKPALCFVKGGAA